MCERMHNLLALHSLLSLDVTSASVFFLANLHYINSYLHYIKIYINYGLTKVVTPVCAHMFNSVNSIYIVNIYDKEKLYLFHISYSPSPRLNSPLLRSGFLKWPPQIALFKVNPVCHVVSFWILKLFC